MDMRPIGVFDSGLGGLTAVRALWDILPEENLIYFGDTARVPYGGRSKETLLKYARQDVRFLRSFDLKAIRIACGTVTATSLSTLQAENDLPIVGLTTEEKAQWLHEQNLFFGDENGFRLTDPLNRVEMGIMMMRLNKGQATVKNNAEYFRKQCPFLDVPDWAQAAFGYLYSQKLIAGQSANSLGAGQVCLQDYAVILLRVLDIEHTYENAVIVAAQHGILTSSQIDGKTPATRGDIVDMTYAAVQLLNN